MSFELPYSVAVYFAAMAEYNATWYPASLAGMLLALAALALALRPPAGRELPGARLVGAVLAIAWLWVGVIHQLQHMAQLNFMAPVYAAAWCLQGAMIAVTCTVRGRVRFRFGGDIRGWTGLGIALWGIAGYPLAVRLLGYGWEELPLAGTAPQPTAILTAGLLLMVRGRPPLYLLVVPLAWAAVAGISAWVLGFELDYSVVLAMLVAGVFALRPRRVE